MLFSERLCSSDRRSRGESRAPLVHLRETLRSPARRYWMAMLFRKLRNQILFADRPGDPRPFFVQRHSPLRVRAIGDRACQTVQRARDAASIAGLRVNRARLLEERHGVVGWPDRSLARLRGVARPPPAATPPAPRRLLGGCRGRLHTLEVRERLGRPRLGQFEARVCRRREPLPEGLDRRERIFRGARRNLRVGQPQRVLDVVWKERRQRLPDADRFLPLARHLVESALHLQSVGARKVGRSVKAAAAASLALLS